MSSFAGSLSPSSLFVINVHAALSPVNSSATSRVFALREMMDGRISPAWRVICSSAWR